MLVDEARFTSAVAVAALCNPLETMTSSVYLLPAAKGWVGQHITG